MAVTKSSDSNSKKTVVKGSEPSCRETTDAGPCELIQLRKSNDSSTGTKYVQKDAHGKCKSYKAQRNRNKGNKSGSFSDIDDAEVSRYLNTKEEIILKRIFWEAMNGNCTTAKKQKRTTKPKKSVSVMKDAKNSDELEVKGRSSRINYDALKFLNDELEQNSETAEISKADSYVNSPHGNISCDSKNSYEDDRRDMSCGKDDQAFDEGDMYNEYEDQHLSDENFNFW